MTTAFDRAYSLQVGPILIDGSNGANDALRVSFRIARDTTTDPNEAEIVVWNLKAEHRAELAAVPSGGTYVKLSAGYVGALGQIFDGWLRKVETIKDGAEWLTRISAGDGEGKIVTSRAYQAFRKGALVRDVLSALVDTMGGDGAALAPNLPPALLTQTIPHGIAVAGNARQCLSQTCKALGLEWHVQSGSIVVTEQGKARATLSVPRITPDTGLLGSPRADKPKTIVFACVMLPELVPGDPVLVESRSIAGLYRVKKTEHAGDSHDGDQWGVNVEAEEL